MVKAKIDYEELLKDKQVQEEISRHLWIKSEKAGYDIGWKKASEDWLENYSNDWVKYHRSSRRSKIKKSDKAQ